MRAMTYVAIQGIEGSFHATAAARLLAPNVQATLLPCATFEEVFNAVKEGRAEYGVTAIENSLHGPINVVYRLLDRNGLWVAGETTLHIDQYLISASQNLSLVQLNSPETIVFSQAPALAQCEAWLTHNLPFAARQETGDTATSVRSVVEENNPHHLAIASKDAAQIYGGNILAGPINDDPHNYTRFVLLQKEAPKQEETSTTAEVGTTWRTSIILTTDHSEGALYRALGAFAAEKISLSKLDSHPIPHDKRHYAFYIDLEAALSHPSTERALAALTEQGCAVKVLGTYAVIL